MSRKQSCEIDLTRSTRHHLPHQPYHENYLSKNYPSDFDKYSNSALKIFPQQKSLASTGQNFLAVKRLPDNISSIRQTFSYNPINLSTQETDNKLKSTKSKNQRLNQLLNIALDLQKLQKKSPINRERSKLSVGFKVNEQKHTKSQKIIEQKTAPSSFGQSKNFVFLHSEKQIKPLVKISKPYNYDKSHSVTVQQQIQKIRQQNQKRKSQNAKPKQNQQSSFYKIKVPDQKNQTFPKKQFTEYFSPKLQKSSHFKTSTGFNTLSPYQSRKKQTSFQIKCHSPSKANQNQIRKISFNQKQKQKVQTKINQTTAIQDFIKLKILGKGRFGVVHLAFHKQTGGLFAMKVVKKQTIKMNKLIDQFILEVKLQSYLNHPFILRLFAIFDDQQNIYLVMEYLQQGCLFHYLKNSKNKKLQETDAAEKIKYLAQSIKYLQDRGIAHRDIKPQNIIMIHGVCKLADFGWATFCDQQRRKTYCGTCDYVAPQILQGQQYDETVDLWCMGVLAYQLVAGKAPFYHMSQKQTRNKIINAKLVFPQDFSENLKSFILGLVQKDPSQRMTIQEALSHPFIKNVNLCD